MAQSPIRLNAVVKKTGVVDALPLLDPSQLFEVLYDGTSYPGTFEGEKGHADFVLTGAGPHVVFRGTVYELKKIHLHKGSEHIVKEDDPEDLELHLVHAPLGSPVASPLVVVAILFTIESSAGNSASSPGIRSLVKGIKSRKSTLINPLEFFPESEETVDTKNWFHYEGSLTSFPYSENVSWFVMRSPSRILASQIKSLLGNANQNPRELQPLDRRLVVRSFP